jgi:hypothetical protein
MNKDKYKDRQVQLEDSQLQCAVLGDYSNYGEKDLWKLLQNSCWVNLITETSQAIYYKIIPNTVGDLSDNPYRTLAWLVRKKNGYCKTEVPFAEFKWATFFYKAGIRPDQVDRAMQIAKTCGTSTEFSLPGCKKEPNQTCALEENDD